MNKGFTLLELMVVIAIITILAVTSVPKLGYNLQKSKDAKVLSFLSILRSSLNSYKSDNNGDTSGKIVELSVYFDNNFSSDLTNGIVSGVVTSYQMKAGIVNKLDGTESLGRGVFAGERHIAEIYYDNSTGDLWIDGTTGSGIDFLDTKENNWNEY